MGTIVSFFIATKECNSCLSYECNSQVRPLMIDSNHLRLTNWDLKTTITDLPATARNYLKLPEMSGIFQTPSKMTVLTKSGPEMWHVLTLSRARGWQVATPWMNMIEYSILPTLVSLKFAWHIVTLIPVLHVPRVATSWSPVICRWQSARQYLKLKDAQNFMKIGTQIIFWARNTMKPFIFDEIQFWAPKHDFRIFSLRKEWPPAGHLLLMLGQYGCRSSSISKVYYWSKGGSVGDSTDLES